MDKLVQYGIIGAGILGAGYIIYEYLANNNSATSGGGSGTLSSVMPSVIQVPYINQTPNGPSNTTKNTSIPSSNTATNGQSINVSSYNPAQPVSITAYGSNQPIIATPISTSNGQQTVSLTGGGTTQLSNELNMNLSTITMPQSTSGYSGNTTAGLVNALSEEQTAYNLLGTANVQKSGYKTTTNSKGQLVYSLG